MNRIPFTYKILLKLDKLQTTHEQIHNGWGNGENNFRSNEYSFKSK